MGCNNSAEKKEQSKPATMKGASSGVTNTSTGSQSAIQANKGRAEQGVRELKANYRIDKSTKILGSGAFGRVFATNNIHDESFEVAIKVMDKHKLNDNIACIIEEVAILNKLDHPNIVRYYETYDDNKYIYLVMEIITGGQLFDKITQQENQTFTEYVACQYMFDLFSAINHCHAQGITHRDIKPENIMVTDHGSLKLIDFGLAKSSNSGKKHMQTMAGTPYYMAPEVLDGCYGKECDLWSLGVLMYTLVSGYLPFQGNSKAEVFQKIRDGDFHFTHAEFNIISNDCKDLIKKLLVVKPGKRIKGQDILKHPWFNQLKESQAVGGEKAKLSPDVLQRLQQFKGVSVLRKAALNMLVKTIDDDQVADLRQAFRTIDEDGTGLIKASELADVLKQSDVKVSEEEIQKMINEIDYHGNGKINYSEFLAATVSIKTFMTDQKLRALFSQFDTNNSGYITEENINNAMQKLGHEINRDEIKDIIKQHDLTHNGMLSFDEFKTIFSELTE